MLPRAWILSFCLLILTPFPPPSWTLQETPGLVAQEPVLQSHHLSGLRPRTIGARVACTFGQD